MGFVYFIHAPEVKRIKIGYSAESPDGRFGSLQTASPVVLERMGLIGGTRDFEQLLHLRFRPHHYQFEWFHATDDLTRFIRARSTVWQEGRRFHRELDYGYSQDWIIQNDPWFVAEARRTRAVEWGEVASDDPATDAIKLRLCRRLKELKHVVGTPRIAKEVGTIRYIGGPDDGTANTTDRRTFRQFCRDGMSAIGNGLHHYYEPDGSADPEGDELVLRHKWTKRLTP